MSYSEESYPARVFLARVTIEFTTPFHIGSGESDGASDAGVVRDWNGLPALPGDSLTGMLRQAYEDGYGVDETRSLFGFQDAQDGQGSALCVSWGLIHDENNEVKEALTLRSKLEADDVLYDAMYPTLRDHVRLGHRGTAEAAGKFDELTVSAGHRFTFELELTGDPEDEEKWQRLLGLLNDRFLRIGGKTRRGLGAFVVQSLTGCALDLSRSEDFQAYLNHSSELSQRPDWQPLKVNPVSNIAERNHEEITLKLVPEDYWMFGGGFDETGTVDSVAVRDSLVVWSDVEEGVRGSLKPVYVIPGSSVKGALSHRVAFHYNRMTGQFADKKSPAELDNLVGEKNLAVRNLFGNMAGENGQPGRVWIDDQFFDVDEENQFVPIQPHVAIDSFTGGARNGFLFFDRPLDDSVLGDDGVLTLTILMKRTSSEELKADKEAEEALRCALVDTCKGRLALGAHQGRGYGYFAGELNSNKVSSI